MNTLPLKEYALQGKRLENIRVFDAHAHIGKYGYPLSLEDQIAEMDRIGIDMAAISSSLAIHGEIRKGNDEIAQAIAKYPHRFIGYVHVSAVYAEQMEEELERCFAIPGFKGIKVYQVGVPYDDPSFNPAWEFARVHKAPVLAHTWAGNLTGFDKAAERNPEVVFLTAHAGSNLVYKPYIEAAKRLPNLYLDLTYSCEHPNMIEHFVETVGVEKIVWGTDTQLFSMAHQISKVLVARIPDELKLKILYTNVAKIFNIF